MASSRTRARRCPCCRHARPHCRCYVNSPRRKPVPVPRNGNPPYRAQIVKWLNLFELAIIIGRRLGFDVYTYQVSAAIRALDLTRDKKIYVERVCGSVHLRQSTEVRPHHLPTLQHYLKERYTP